MFVIQLKNSLIPRWSPRSLEMRALVRQLNGPAFIKTFLLGTAIKKQIGLSQFKHTNQKVVRIIFIKQLMVAKKLNLSVNLRHGPHFISKR